MHRKIVFCAVSLSMVCAATAGEPKDAAPWPQFRGPGGQGHVSTGIPAKWSETENLAWEAEIPGRGWSSPAIADGAIWMTTAALGKDGGASLRAVAVDRATGKVIHNVEVFAPSKGAKLHARNSLATPSPVIHRGRVYVHFGADGVACLDAATAKAIWTNDQLKADYQTGAASSPVIYKNLLIIPCDGADVQFAVGLDADTGKIVWKTERPEGAKKAKTNDARRAFATPLVIHAAGRDQVVMPGAHCVYSYDPADGTELWRATYSGFSNVPRPVFAHGLVYVVTGFAPPEILAIRPDGKGDVTKTHIAWRYRKNVPNIPSPVVVGDRLFMVSDKAVATCLDAKTGEEKWSERLVGGFSASLLTDGKTIYAFGDEGTTFLFEASDTFKEIGRNELPGRIQATPAAVDGSLFLRMEKRLVKIGKGG